MMREAEDAGVSRGEGLGTARREKLGGGNKVVVFRPGDAPNPAIGRLAPYTRTQKPLQGKATAYVCQNYVCNAPTTDPQAMLRALGMTTRTATPPVRRKP